MYSEKNVPAAGTYTFRKTLDVLLIKIEVGGYQTTVLLLFIYSVFLNHRNTVYLLNITIIFDRCRRSLSALTPFTYKYDSVD